MKLLGISALSFSNNSLLAKSRKIISNAMRCQANISYSNSDMFSGVMITVPNRKGFMHISGSRTSDALILAQDFAKVQHARRAGILKPVRVSKFGF